MDGLQNASCLSGYTVSMPDYPLTGFPFWLFGPILVVAAIYFIASKAEASSWGRAVGGLFLILMAVAIVLQLLGLALQ